MTQNSPQEGWWPIPIRKEHVQAADTTILAQPDAALDRAYLHAMVDVTAEWAAQPENKGGLGLLVPPGTFAETPQGRYRRMARQLYAQYGANTPWAVLAARKTEVAEELGLPAYCPAGRDAASWCAQRLRTIEKEYQRLQYAGRASQKEPEYVTKMIPAAKVQQAFFDQPFYPGRENQFLCPNGFLGHGRGYRSAPQNSSWNTAAGLWRDADHCGCLTACYVDLDCYKRGFLDPAQVAAYYLSQIDGRWLPCCSAVVISGRGCYVLWLFSPTNVEEYGDALLSAHRCAESLLVTLLAGLGADPAATDPARVLRIPGSVHHKPGNAPRPVYVAYLRRQGGCIYIHKDAIAFFRALEAYTGAVILTEEREQAMALAGQQAACLPVQAEAALPVLAQNTRRTTRPAPAGKWALCAQPPLESGEPLVLRPLPQRQDFPPAYRWLVQAEPYRYRPGAKAAPLALRLAHDMAVLLLYFDKGTDYTSRHIAFYWLWNFLCSSQLAQADIGRLLRAIGQRMPPNGDDPFPEKDVERLLQQTPQLRRITADRLIHTLHLAPRTQPYMQGLLYRAETARRRALRNAAYEQRRKGKRARPPAPAKPDKQESQRKALARQRADRRAQEALCMAKALLVLAQGESQRSAARRSGLGKGTVARLHQAWQQDARCGTARAATAAACGLRAETYLQAAALTVRQFPGWLAAETFAQHQAEDKAAHAAALLARQLVRRQEAAAYLAAVQAEPDAPRFAHRLDDARQVMAVEQDFTAQAQANCIAALDELAAAKRHTTKMARAPFCAIFASDGI